MTRQVILDLDRERRIALSEAALCEPKSVQQIEIALRQAADAGRSLLMTRLSRTQLQQLPRELAKCIDYDEMSRTGIFGATPPCRGGDIAIVTGGTSDIAVAREAVRTLYFHGRAALEVYDVGVAGLWRLQEQVTNLGRHRTIIAIAGMDAALPTVLAGLVSGLIIAVPTSTGYGVAADGTTALNSLLASCAPGLVVTNIDNGYGAACAAMRSLS